MKEKKLILGIDVGITSVGWGIIDEDYTVIDMGVRLFDEASKDNNEKRRGFRGGRRLKRRRQFRIERLRNLLKQGGVLLDTYKPHNNPYAIRVKGLNSKLTNDELVSALVHIAKRRGSSLETIDDSDKKTSDNKLTPKAALSLNQVKLQELGFISKVQLERLNNGEKIRNDANVFKTEDYIKEVKQILSNQSLSEEINNKIIEIISSRRHFSDGPGSQNSPTKYGRWRFVEEKEKDELLQVINNKHQDKYLKQNFVLSYKDKEYKVFKNGNIINKNPYNLIELMRGKCSLYPDELRAPKGSIAAEEFNLINDLVNLRIVNEENRKLNEVEIEKTINYLRKNGVFKPKGVKGFVKLLDLELENITGFRLDKDKPTITEFNNHLNVIKSLTEEEFSAINSDEILNSVAEVLTSFKAISERFEQINKIINNKEISVKLANLKGFSEYHSLSFKAISELRDEMIEQRKNQQEIITNMNLRTKDKIAKLTLDESAILSPVAKRAHRQALKLIEALINEFGNFDSIVVETTREKNSDDQRRIIRNQDKINQTRREAAEELAKKHFNVDRGLPGQLILKLRLYEEQDGKCAYTGTPINIETLIKDHKFYEVDHIIPKSISFDDSFNNKVLVLHAANQSKGNKTPFTWFKSGNTNSKYKSFEEFEQIVLSNKNYSKQKKINLLLKEDINKYDVQQDFIARNLIDTSYAARSLQTSLRNYFSSNSINTKIYSVKGIQTNNVRTIANVRYANKYKAESFYTAPLKKDRNQYYHHAVDALIIAGLSRQENFNAKPFLYNKEEYRKNANIEYDPWHDKLLATLINQLNELDYEKTRYSWKVDTKPNRSVSDQTIYSTRLVDGVEYLIKKYKDVKTIDSKKLEKIIIDEKEKLLVYHNDVKTYNLLVDAFNQYKHEKYPYQAYEENHGPLRKYSKKGNGPIVKDLKYRSNRLGNHISISQNYNSKDKNVVLLQISTFRTDIYQDKNGLHKLLAVRYPHVKKTDSGYSIDSDVYQKLKKNNNIYKDDKFMFSLYRNSIVDIKTKKKDVIESSINRFVSTNNEKRNIIEVKEINFYNTENKRDMRTIGKDVVEFNKYNVSITGKYSKVVSEDLKLKF